MLENIENFFSAPADHRLSYTKSSEIRNRSAKDLQIAQFALKNAYEEGEKIKEMIDECRGKVEECGEKLKESEEKLRELRESSVHKLVFASVEHEKYVQENLSEKYYDMVQSEDENAEVYGEYICKRYNQIFGRIFGPLIIHLCPEDPKKDLLLWKTRYISPKYDIEQHPSFDFVRW